MASIVLCSYERRMHSLLPKHMSTLSTVVRTFIIPRATSLYLNRNIKKKINCKKNLCIISLEKVKMNGMKNEEKQKKNHEAIREA